MNGFSLNFKNILDSGKTSTVLTTSSGESSIPITTPTTATIRSSSTSTSTTTISPQEFEKESTRIINEVQNTISGIIKNVVASKQNESKEQNLDDVIRLINEAIPEDVALKALKVDEKELKNKIVETVGGILTNQEIERVVRLRNRTQELEETFNLVDMPLLNDRVTTVSSLPFSPAPTPAKTTAKILYELDLTNIDGIESNDYDSNILDQSEVTTKVFNQERKEYVEIPNITEKLGE